MGLTTPSKFIFILLSLNTVSSLLLFIFPPSFLSLSQCFSLSHIRPFCYYFFNRHKQKNRTLEREPFFHIFQTSTYDQCAWLKSTINIGEKNHYQQNRIPYAVES